MSLSAGSSSPPGNPTQAALLDGHNVSGPDKISASLRENREQDRRKGIAISHQITIWNALLDARIQLQKAISATNRLPRSSRWFNVDESPADDAQSVVQEAFELSRELNAFQSNLHRADGLDVNGISDPSEIQGVGESISSWSSAASDVERVYHSHLVRTLSKWSTKTQVTNMGTTGFKSSKNPQEQAPGVVSIIQDILEAEGEALLARSRVASANDGPQISSDPNTFNDTDFYQQLLRDIIDFNTSGSGGDQQAWMQRQSKAKHGKTVDTKASKGRKLRYEVHERIQHFMIPIPVIVGGWPDEQRDELFSSLINK